MFNLKRIPADYNYFYLPGFEAVDPVVLKDRLETIFAKVSFASNKKAKIRLVFGVIDVSPRDLNWRILDEASSTDNLHFLHNVRNLVIKTLHDNVYFEDVGFEFIYSSEVVQALAKVINMVVLYQGKRPDDVHIGIDFWALVDDDCNNDNDDDDDDYPDQGAEDAYEDQDEDQSGGDGMGSFCYIKKVSYLLPYCGSLWFSSFNEEKDMAPNKKNHLFCFAIRSMASCFTSK